MTTPDENVKAAQRLYDAAFLKYVNCPPWRWLRCRRLLVEANAAWADLEEARGR